MSHGPFKDHFSGHAEDYARHRPGYPQALFDWLLSISPGHSLAWDVGTGNGQVARGLRTGFNRVHATDASAEQLAQAKPLSRVQYALEPAENSTLASASVDLVTVGQALHWFDATTFHAEVKRVLRPGGVIAAFTYQLCRVSPAVDAVVQTLYSDIVGPWWPPERVHVDRGYSDLPFPYDLLPTPNLALESRLELAGYVDYLATWSAVRRYRAEYGRDPLDEIRRALGDAWGAVKRVRTVVWPLVIRAGRCRGGSVDGQDL